MEGELSALCVLGNHPGLERIQALLELLGHPEKNISYVHVAGTNGKGSSSMMIAAALSRAGYRCARFSSPHLHSYRERFLIDGKPISADLLYQLLQEVKACITGLRQQGITHPTEFEVLTAIGFLFFQRAQAEIAVLEVGMGGIYDSTNVIEPLVSLITSLDYDHTAFLGESLEEIAANKAGIIKPEVPVIVGDLDASAQAVITARAEELAAPLWNTREIMMEVLERKLSGQRLRFTTEAMSCHDLHLNLLGTYQIENLKLAVRALQILNERGFAVSAEAFASAMADLQMPGRMEVVRQQPLIILDAAHNPQGARVLSRSVQELLPDRKCVLLCGILDDKELPGIMDPLADICRAVVVSRPEGNRSAHWQRVAEYVKVHWPTKPLLATENIAVALQQALAMLEPQDYLLISGSFYLLSPVRSLLVTV